MLDARIAQAIPCPDCGTEVAPHFLVCPGCHRLVHAETLKRLADEAGAAEKAGDPTSALVAWRSALELLPPASRQHEAIRKKVDELGRAVDASPGGRKQAARADGKGAGWAGGLGFAGMALMVLSKLKLLVLGLTKASTLFSMFLTMGVYWTLWGWPFAVGLVLSIYVHEMGHVAALVRYGIKADAPMFIPGLGAVIRARQHLSNPREDAQVGLAGPLWGLGAALACWGLFYGTGQLIFAGIAKVGAYLNLFNLLPLWQLDGGRAFNAFGRKHRWLATLVLSLLWATTEESLLLILTIAGAYRASVDPPPAETDLFSLAEYLGLAAVLALMVGIEVPLPGG